MLPGTVRTCRSVGGDAVGELVQVEAGQMVDGHLADKSSCSSNGGECVEVSANAMQGTVPVRDSKDPEGPTLAFPVDVFAAFIAGVKAGEFGEV